MTEPTSATSTATRGPQAVAQMASLWPGLNDAGDGTAIRFSLGGTGLKLLKGVTSGPDTFSDEGSGDFRGMHLRLKPAALAGGRQALVSTTAWRYSFYSPEMNLLSETELRTTIGTPVVLYDYVWFNGQPIAQVDGTAVIHWTFTDHVGTPILQTDAAGNPFWRAEYEPYGRVFQLRTADQHQPLRLPGQEADQMNLGQNGKTDRKYNIFRWYRARQGRYTQPDPLDVSFIKHQMPGSLGDIANAPHRYGYGAANPILFTDRLGLKECGPTPTRFQFSSCEMYCKATKEWGECTLEKQLYAITAIGGVVAIGGGILTSFEFTPVGGACVAVGIGAATLGLEHVYGNYARAINEANFKKCMQGCVSEACNRTPPQMCPRGSL